MIDDNSPDGTGQLAGQLTTKLDFISVLHRKRKEGLGPAYVAGFRRVLADGADYVLELHVLSDAPNNPVHSSSL